MASSKDKIENKVPRRRSIMASLLIPDIAADVRPLRETTAVFVNLIAMLFVANGLFPKDHPALVPGSKVKLSLNQVMHTAWTNVSFTREKLPQTLFFFAVVGCMGFVGLSVFIAFCSIFVGKAHAQVFTAPGGNGLGSTDLAQEFINYLFQATTFADLDQNSSGAAQSPTGTGGDVIIQCALYTALGVYSDAILIVAAMILFYHLAWMTVETAHHGVVMGQRGNQIWAPIRLVFAIGLLVPVGGAAPPACPGGTGTGMNSGQFLVIAVAQWGSGMASNVWATFLTALSADQYTYVPPAPPNVRKIVEDVLDMYMCQYAFNWQLDSGESNSDAPPAVAPLGLGSVQSIGGYPNSPGVPLGVVCGPNCYTAAPLFDTALDVSQPAAAGDTEICEPNGYLNNNLAPGCPLAGPNNPFIVTVAAGAASPGYAPASGQTDTTRYIFGNQYTGDSGICGSYLIPASPVMYDTSFVGKGLPGAVVYEQNIMDGIYIAETDAFNNMAAQAMTAMNNQYAQYFLVGNQAYGQQVINPPVNILSTLIDAYQLDLATKIDAAMLAVNGDNDNADMAGLLAYFTNAGWVTAGSWFNRVARLQEDITSAGHDALPSTTPPLLAKALATQGYFLTNGSPDRGTNIAKNSTYLSAKIAMDQFKQWLTGNTIQDPALITGNVQSQMILSCNETASSPAGPDDHSPTDVILWLIDHIAACNGVWHPVPAGGGGPENLLGVQFRSANPLAEIAEFGQANLNTAYKMADIGMYATFAGGTVQGLFPVLPAGLTPGVNGTINGLAELGMGLGSLMLTLAAVFFTIGFTMAFFVPLIPFMNFFFGVLTWIVAMLEAVIAVPLVALAHLNPEGAGLPGDLARTAYFFIFQVFLRPVLMIFGLLVGFMIFYLAVAFLNAMFPIAVSGTGGLNHGHYTAARIIYTAIYVLLVISSANHSFQLITRLPDTAMQWMGQSGLQGANMGDPAALERDVSAVQGIATQQGIQQFGNLTAGGGKAVGKIGRMLGMGRGARE